MGHAYVPKKRFLLVVLFFANSSRKNDFQPVKSSYFCVGKQKKKKKNRLKRTAKKNAFLEHVNRISVASDVNPAKLDSTTNSRFTCPKTAVPFTGSFFIC